MSLSKYMMTWQTATTGVYNVYQEALKAEEAAHARFATLSKFVRPSSSNTETPSADLSWKDRKSQGSFIATLGSATKAKAASLQKGGMYPAHVDPGHLEHLRKTHEVCSNHETNAALTAKPMQL